MYTKLMKDQNMKPPQQAPGLTLLYNRKVFGGRAHSVAVNCHQAASLPQSGASPRGHEQRSIFAQKA